MIVVTGPLVPRSEEFHRYADVGQRVATIGGASGGQGQPNVRPSAVNFPPPGSLCGLLLIRAFSRNPEKNRKKSEEQPADFKTVAGPGQI